jgi:hypothetical protein
MSEILSTNPEPGRIENFLNTYALNLENFTSPTDSEILGNAFEIDPDFAQQFLEERFPEPYEIMKKMGVHPTSGPSEFLDPVASIIREEDFSNIGQHVSCVGLVAYALGESLKECGVISEEAHQNVVKRALLHDVSKPTQIFMLRAIRTGSLSQDVFFNPEPIFDQAISFLVAKGLNPIEAQAVFYDYGSETGSEPERMKDFISADSSGLNTKISAALNVQLVHLADDMMGSTKPSFGNPARNFVLSTRERVLLTQPRDPNYIGWKVGLALNQQDQIVSIPDVRLVEPSLRVLGSSYGLQMWSSDFAICHNLTKLLGLRESMSDSARVIKSALVERISRIR